MIKFNTKTVLIKIKLYWGNKYKDIIENILNIFNYKTNLLYNE
jgi:hypothetical protein